MKSIFLVLLFLTHIASAQEEDVDYMALGTLLVRDGHFSRAEGVLKKAKPEASQQALFESLKGIISIHKKQYKIALEYFDKSLSLGIKNKEIYIYMAESHLNLKELAQAEIALSKVGKIEKAKLPYYLLKAEVYWQKKEKKKAWSVLNEALNKKLSLSVINKKKFTYYMKDQLYFVAYELAFDFLKKNGPWGDVLAMASQLRVNKQYDLSLKLLQTLAFVKTSNENIALEMTQNYLALGETFSGALVLEEAARVNTNLTFEASELLRQVGKSYRSRYLNFQTLDPKKRLKQKISLYLEDDDYHSLKLMIPELNKHQMFENEELRYAMAYSLFRTGDFKRSESYLKVIENDDLFEKSLKLREEISKCKSQTWACSETI